jgi:hypothetical protein
MHRGEQVAQQWVHAPGVAPEHAHPVDAGKPVGQFLQPCSGSLSAAPPRGSRAS